MSLRRAIAIFVAAMALIVAVVLIYVLTLDFERHRAKLASELRELTGRAVEIDGSVDLSLGLRSAFVINGLRIGNTAWGTRPDLLKVGKVEAQFQLLPLLAGRIKIERLRFVQADLWLETNSDGQLNWILPTRANNRARKTEEIPPAQPQLLGMVGVAALDLVAGRVSFRDGRSGDIQVLAVAQASADGDGFAQAGAVRVEGSWNGLPMAFEGQVGPLSALLREGANAYPIDLSGKLAGMQIDAKGTVSHPTRGEGIRLQVKARADRLTGFVPALGEAAARLNHVTMSGRFDFRDRIVKIEDGLGFKCRVVDRIRKRHPKRSIGAVLPNQIYTVIPFYIQPHAPALGITRDELVSGQVGDLYDVA